jgi:hypothetical protein
MLLDEAGHGAGLALAAKRAASDRRPPKVSLGCFKSDVDDRDDPVVAVDDDDLITNDEVHVPAPLGVDLDERRGNRHHPHAGWHCGAGAEGEVDVIDPRHIAPGQDRLSDLRALLRCQVHAAARLALLRLTLLSLSLLRSLAWLSLTWLSLTLLTGLALLRRLTCLALLTLLSLRSLARALIPLLLRLPLFALLRSRFALTLGRLACGLSFLTALRLALLLSLRGLLGLIPLLLRLPLFALLRSRFALTLGRLACGLSFLTALRLALLLSLRGLLGLALLRRRLGLLALGGAAALFSSTLHGLS